MRSISRKEEEPQHGKSQTMDAEGVLANRDWFRGGGAGRVWLSGGLEIFLNEDNRIEFAKLAEKGEIQFFGDPQSPFCKLLPLALIDFRYIETGTTGCLLYEEASWKSACQTLSLYAAVCGLAHKVDMTTLQSQCEQIATLPPPGRNKP